MSSLAGVVLVVLASGCSSGQRVAGRVDPEVAREVLENVLEDWSQGGDPEAWRKQSPEVVVQDLDWTDGMRLKSYEIVEPGCRRDANLFLDVNLVMEDSNRNIVKRSVTYCVGTDPVLTVFRAMGP